MERHRESDFAKEVLEVRVEGEPEPIPLCKYFVSSRQSCVFNSITRVDQPIPSSARPLSDRVPFDSPRYMPFNCSAAFQAITRKDIAKAQEECDQHDFSPLTIKDIKNTKPELPTFTS